MVGKTALKSLPIVGGIAGYQEAKAAGMTDKEALAYAGVEAISPLPVSSLEAKKFIEEEAPRRATKAREAMARQFGDIKEPIKSRRLFPGF